MFARIGQPAEVFIHFRSLPSHLPAQRKPNAAMGCPLDAGARIRLHLRRLRNPSSAPFSGLPGKRVDADADNSFGTQGATDRHRRRPDA